MWNSIITGLNWWCFLPDGWWKFTFYESPKYNRCLLYMCRYMQKELIRVGILKKCPTIEEKKHHQFFENVPKIQHLFVPKITNMFFIVINIGIIFLVFGCFSQNSYFLVCLCWLIEAFEPIMLFLREMKTCWILGTF